MEVKLCECGCGNPAPIATKTNRAEGVRKGEPRRFIHGHMTARWKGGTRPGYHHRPNRAQRRLENRQHAQHEDGMTYREIADESGDNLKTVEARIRRTQRRINAPRVTTAPRRLTAVEAETVRPLKYGKTVKEIAHILGREPSTVRSTISRARAKLGVVGGNQVSLVLALQEHGYITKPIEPEPPEWSKPLSPSWRAYLASWDRLLRARDHEVARACLELRIRYANSYLNGECCPSRTYPQSGHRPLQAMLDVCNCRAYWSTA